MRVLDGTSLARERQPALAEQAQTVLQQRGRPPALLLLAFGDDGHAPHVNRKLAAAAAVGVRVVPLILPTASTTDDALAALARTIEQTTPDAVFLQVPFPPHIDEETLARAIPPGLDVDVMNPEQVRRFNEQADLLPPVTVTAGLQLLDAGGIGIEGVRGIVVADPNPFAEMFREALTRRGANMAPLVSPTAQDLHMRVAEAGLVVVAAASPGVVRSADLAPGCIVIDVGYFNPGGRGDIDTRSGIAHLGAIAPVPGGIGPMTISALLERTIQFAS